MRLNRKSIAVGLTLGALAGGAGGAIAASGTSSTTTTPTTPYGLGPGHMGAMRGAAFGHGAPITAAASYLGLSQAELQAQLRSGKTLAQVAEAQGKSVSGLESAMTATMTKNIDANSALSASQKASILTQMKDRLGAMVNSTCPRGGSGAGGLGPGAGPMMRTMRG